MTLNDDQAPALNNSLKGLGQVDYRHLCNIHSYQGIIKNKSSKKFPMWEITLDFNYLAFYHKVKQLSKTYQYIFLKALCG